MSFELLITLIIIVATIVQAVGRARRQGQSPPARPRPSQAPRQTTTQTTRQTRQQPRAELPQGDFSTRLEEARRRVQEAMAGGESPSATRTVRGAEEVGTLVSERRPLPASSREGQTLETSALESRGVEGSSLESASLENVEERLGRRVEARRAERDFDTAPPMRVQRIGRPKTAKLARDGLMQLDAKSIYQGVIWHQIFSDPLSKRNTRRRLSRRP